MTDAASKRQRAHAPFARLAALCAPLLMAGCYVVPVAPATYPGYRHHQPKPDYYPSPRPYYRGPYGPYGMATEPGAAPLLASFEHRAGRGAVPGPAPAAATFGAAADAASEPLRLASLGAPPR